MGIEVASGFERKSTVPLDEGSVVADLTALEAIEAGIRYEGMVVYVVAEATNFQLIGGIDNENWEELSGSGGSGGGGIEPFVKDSHPAPYINDNGVPFFDFSTDEFERLFGLFTVDAKYKPGNSVGVDGIRVAVNSSDDTRTFKLIAGVYLFKEGTDPSSLANASAIENVELVINVSTDTYGIISTPTLVLAQDGEVDSVAVDPGDVILFIFGFVAGDSPAYVGPVRMFKNLLSPNMKV